MKGLHAAKRWMYRHDRPGRAAAFANRIQALAASSGFGVKHVVTLEVPGRRTGRLRSFPVVVADYRDQRHLVAILGENTNWIRNVEAAEGNVGLRHGERERVRLEPVRPGDRPEILRRYLQVAPGARPHIPVDRRSPLAKFEQIAPEYPVFRIRPAPDH